MLQNLINKLSDPSPEVRESAADKIARRAERGLLTIDDAKMLIVAATGKFPELKDEWDDPAANLIRAARDAVIGKRLSVLLPVIESNFAKLSSAAMLEALDIITLCTTPKAARLYVACLNQHGDKLSGALPPPTYSGPPRAVAQALFPALLAVAPPRAVMFAIFEMLVEFRNGGLLPAGIVGDQERKVVRLLKSELAEARSKQRAKGIGWRYEEPYVAHRDLLGLLFDVIGTLDSPRLLGVLRTAGDLLDPRLRCFRAISLLRRGVKVPEHELDWIARSPRERFVLFELLSKHKLVDRLPAACREQAALAEGHMVDWLCFGTELGREPDEIELIHRETRPLVTRRELAGRSRNGRPSQSSRPVDYFFFKYRVTERHWSKKDGWMVGMAGPYFCDEQPTTSPGELTFSRFTKFGKLSLRKHVAEYLG